MRLISKRQLKNNFLYYTAQRIEAEKDKVIKKVIAFNAMPYSERKRSHDEWDEYFEKVKKTRACKRFFKQREAGRDFATVKELATEAREQREADDWELVEPYSPNSELLLHSMEWYKYRGLLGKIEETKEELKKMGDKELLAEDL